MITLRHLTHSSRTLWFGLSSATSNTGTAPHITTVICKKQTLCEKRDHRDYNVGHEDSLPVLTWFINSTCKRVDAASNFMFSEFDFIILTKDAMSTVEELSSAWWALWYIRVGDTGGLILESSILNDKKRGADTPDSSTISSPWTSMEEINYQWENYIPMEDFSPIWRWCVLGVSFRKKLL